MHCPACFSATTAPCGSIEGYIQGSSFEIIECLDCRTRFSNPHESEPEVYELIYRNSDIAPGYARYAAYRTDVPRARFPMAYLGVREGAYYGAFTMLRSETRKGARVLDVGCGLGYFTHALRASGFDAFGIDHSKEAIDEATRAFGPYYRAEDFFTLTNERFDAICMIEVIEHVNDPVRYLEKAKELLNEGGVIILTTPNRDWYRNDILWASDIPPVHLSWFSEKGARALGERIGLSTRFFDFFLYNLAFGTLRWPINESFSREAVFKADGTTLFTPYYKSNLRKRLERLGLYPFAIFMRALIIKIRDILTAVIQPASFSGRRSSVMVACLSK